MSEVVSEAGEVRRPTSFIGLLGRDELVDAVTNLQDGPTDLAFRVHQRRRYQRVFTPFQLCSIPSLLEIRGKA